MTEFTYEELTALIKTIPVGATKQHAGMKPLIRMYDDNMDTSREIYFALDRIDMWETLRPHPASTTGLLWVRQNLEHALQHCPLMVGHWAQFSQEDSMVLVDEVGLFIDKEATVTDQDRLAILRGEPCQKYLALGGLFRYSLRQDAEHITVLSPAWLGVAQSELRTELLTCGWTPDMLPRMCRLHADKPGAKDWVEQWSFPYTLMLLDFHIHGVVTPEFANEYQQTGQWPVWIHAGANPVDVVVARAVLPYVDSAYRNYTLNLPASMAQPEALLPPGEAAKLVQLVDVYMGLGMGQTLLDHFTRQSLMPVPDGKMLGIDGAEGLALPELGGL